jgi:hypothetical protein
MRETEGNSFLINEALFHERTERIKTKGTTLSKYCTKVPKLHGTLQISTKVVPFNIQCYFKCNIFFDLTSLAVSTW